MTQASNERQRRYRAKRNAKMEKLEAFAKSLAHRDDSVGDDAREALAS